MKDLSRIQSSRIWKIMDDDDKQAIRAAHRILQEMWHVPDSTTYDNVLDNFGQFANRKDMILHVATITDVQCGKIVELTAIMNLIATAINHTTDIW